MAEVIDKLYRNISTDATVPRILGVTRAGCTSKRFVLVEDVVYANLNLASLVLEDLATEVEIAQNVVLVVFVGETDILHIRSTRRECQTLQEHPLYATIYRVVEVVVLLGLTDGVPSLIVCSVPRYGEVEVLRDVTTEGYACIVADVVGVVGVEYVVNHILQYVAITRCSVDCRRNTIVRYTSLDIEVALHKR